MNSAFDGVQLGAEVARILSELSVKTYHETGDTLSDRNLKDVNGNTVGQARWVESK